VLFKPGQFCALAVFVGCCLYTLLTLQFGMQLTMAAYITIAVTFALRILAIRFDWRTRAMVPGSGSGSAA
jgi:uncharacterized membrane protein YeiH